MWDYIDQQWLAWCEFNQWGSVLCADLRHLLRLWLRLDADVRYILGCNYRAWCSCNLCYRRATVCCLNHVSQRSRLDLCMLAVQRDAFVIGDIENPSEELALAAVRVNGDALTCIVNPSKAVCLAAVQ